jgi:Zn-dependent peptidase ImmA (M78 family)
VKVPKEFTLGAITWSVSKVETLPGAMGVTTYDHAKIEVLKGLSTQVKEQTFCHELVHAILHAMGKAMPHDEEFVDGFATFLHQYLKTAK